MTTDERRALREAMRIQEYRNGWNDRMRGRPQQSRALGYLVGYTDAGNRTYRHGHAR